MGIIIDNDLLGYFNQLTKDTRISKSKLLEEAIEDLRKKYGIEKDSRQ
jgi:predicted transcriptional regulator